MVLQGGATVRTWPSRARSMGPALLAIPVALSRTQKAGTSRGKQVPRLREALLGFRVHPQTAAIPARFVVGTRGVRLVPREVTLLSARFIREASHDPTGATAVCCNAGGTSSGHSCCSERSTGVDRCGRDERVPGLDRGATGGRSRHRYGSFLSGCDAVFLRSSQRQDRGAVGWQARLSRHRKCRHASCVCVLARGLYLRGR